MFRRRWSFNSFRKTFNMPGRQESPIRDRSSTDPDTCLEVFESHWLQIVEIIDCPGAKNNQTRAQITSDEVQAVVRYLDQMLLLLVEEESINGSQGPILQYLLCENIMERVRSWCNKTTEFHERLKLEQLKHYELIINQGNQPLIVHKPLIRPLLLLLASCAEPSNPSIETHMILVLNHLCVALTQNPNLLELFFSASTEQGPARFFMFSLLIPYVHREGPIGQQARDALLLIMALSFRNESIGKYIAENSDFCPVLATGLSGLYSSLPRKLEIQADDWSRLNREDWLLIPDLVMFLNSLEFCNAVVQVAHPLVREQLLNFIYIGFLVPVLGPALHQNSMEEVIAATAYLDLFIRQITEPALMKTFLRFILTEKHDEIIILESLITRINSNTRLCMVSLTLFKTLIDLNCEEVMYQLIFRYIISCTHVMKSQRKAIKDPDLHGKTAEKFLSMTPTCCVPDWTDSPQNVPSTPELHRAAHPDPSMSFPPGTYGSQLDHYETSYMDYLKESQTNIAICAKSCRCWSYPYDGERPAPDSLVKKAHDDANDSAFIDGQQLDEPDLVVLRSSNRKVSNIETFSSNMESLKIESHGQTKGDSRRNSVVDVSSTRSANTNPEQGDTNSVVVSGSGSLPLVTRNDDVESLDSGMSDMDRSQDEGDGLDLNVFLHGLKRVKTPDYENVSIEDSIHELDSLIKDLTVVDPYRPRSFSNASHRHSVYDCDYYRCRNYSEISELSLRIRSESTVSDMSSRMRTDSILSDTLPPMDVNLSEFESSASASETLQAIPVKESSVSREGSPATHDLSGFSAKKMQSSYGGEEKKFENLGPPNIGPFLTVILQKLESLMQNTFYVNLLLTGVFTRLATYPQPLLRSFLINHNLVFQPQVKSLIQVLGSIKHKIDCFSYTVDNFESLLLRARRFLAWRDSMQGMQDVSKARSDSMFIPGNGPGVFVPQRTRASSTAIPAEKRRPSFSDFFRRSPLSDKDGKKGGSRLEKLSQGGYRYINTRPITQPIQESPAQSIKVKNAVYAAIVLEEFLKELAALSQEHALLYGDDDGYHSCF